MPGTFSPPLRVSDPDMHHGTCATHVPWCMPGSLTSGLLWNWWRRKRSRHSRRMRNPQFYVSDKRSIATSPALVVRSIQSCAIHIAHILLWICDGHFRCRLCNSTHYFNILFYKMSEGKNGMKRRSYISKICDYKTYKYGHNWQISSYPLMQSELVYGKGLRTKTHIGWRLT